MPATSTEERPAAGGDAPGPKLCSSRPTRLSALVLATLLIVGAVMWRTGENVVASTEVQSKATRPRPDLTRLPSRNPSEEELDLRAQMKSFLHNEIGGPAPAMFKDGTADLKHMLMAMNQKLVMFFMPIATAGSDSGTASASASGVAPDAVGEANPVKHMNERMAEALTRIAAFQNEDGSSKPAALLVERLFAVMDADESGIVSEAEYKQASASIDKDPMAFAFALVDADTDASLSKKELRDVAAATVSLGVDVYGQILDAMFEAITATLPDVMAAVPGTRDQMHDFDALYKMTMPPADRAGLAAASQLAMLQWTNPIAVRMLVASSKGGSKLASGFRAHLADAAGADQDAFADALALVAGLDGDAETVDGAASLKPEEVRMVQGLIGALQRAFLGPIVGGGADAGMAPGGSGAGTAPGHLRGSSSGSADSSSGANAPTTTVGPSSAGVASAIGAGSADAAPELTPFQLKVATAFRAAEKEQFPVLSDLLYFLMDRDGDGLVTAAEVEVHTNLTRAFTAERMAVLSPAQLKIAPMLLMQGAELPPAAARVGMDIVLETTRALFALIDVNGDGYVTVDEASIEADSLLKAVAGAASVAVNMVEEVLLDDEAGLLDPVLDGVVAVTDVNADGSVQLPELLRMISLLQGKAPPPVGSSGTGSTPSSSWASSGASRVLMAHHSPVAPAAHLWSAAVALVSA